MFSLHTIKRFVSHPLVDDPSLSCYPVCSRPLKPLPLLLEKEHVDIHPPETKRLPKRTPDIGFPDFSLRGVRYCNGDGEMARVRPTK